MSSGTPVTATAAAPPSSGLQPGAYADAFARGSPREGVQRIQTRLHKARILTDELADYFAARRELESSYLKTLAKISRRSFLSDPSALGPNFAPVYERLVVEIGELASIHGELEKKLEAECEIAMRSAPNRGEWGRIKDHDDNLASTLKEINTLEVQLSKDQKKAEVASSKKAGQAQQKVSETERSLSQTMEVWDTEAPFAFEAYQKIDAQRLDLMKEIVAKFETAQSDAAQRTMQVTEQTMQVLLNFDPQADMQEFALRNATASSRPSQRGTVSGSSDRNAATRPVSASGRSQQPAATLPVGGSNGNAGIGTNGVSEFGAVRPSSASIHSYDRPRAGANEPREQQQQQQQQQQSTPSRIGGSSTLKSALTRFGRGRSGKNVNDNTTSVYGNLGDQTDASMAPPASSSASTRSAQRGRGMGSEEQRSSDSSGPSAAGLSSAAGAAAASAGIGGAAAAGGLMAPLTPSRKQSSVNTSATTAAAAAPPMVDAEGYSIPPPDRKPWETGPSSASAAGASSLMDDDDESEARDMSTSMDASLPKMTGMSIAPQAIPESAEQDHAALERMRSTLLTARSPVTAPQRRNTTRRDRRDVRNTTYNPGLNLPAGIGTGVGGGSDETGGSGALTSTTAASQAPALSPFGGSAPMASSPISQPSAFVGSPGVGGDRTQSIVSMSSASAAPGNPFEGAAPGLRANILERVNVLFSGRQVEKIMIAGEISVSLRDVAASREPLHIRLESFEQLEKAAPNPAFLQPVEGDRPGEYRLNVGALLDQGGSGSGGQAVLLQYKVHVSDSRMAEYVPLDVSTQWRCEPHQTSMLLNFSPNAKSKLTMATRSGASEQDAGLPVSLQDMSLTVDAGPTNVTGVMSKPSGTWLAEQKRMYWRLPGDVNLSNGLIGSSGSASAESAPQKILARWQVDGQGQPQPVQIRWRVPNRTLSSLSLSVMDETTSGLRFESVSRQTVSGKYIANP